MHEDKIRPLILSGGAGTRLWPVSRAVYPKQLLPLVGDDSLLRQTADRVADPEAFAPPMVVCKHEHRFLVAEQLDRADRPPGRIILEPVGRNTAPAACVGALLAAREAPDALILLLPSDHHIGRPEAFRAAVANAAEAARDGWLVTFGIRPDRPETGYGYIGRGPALEAPAGCFRVARFVEKPERAEAVRLLAGGDYSWNSGMFLFRADRLIEEVERYQPEVLAACRAALAGAEADLDFLRLEAEAFAEQPSISIDYAVMERTDRAALCPVDIGWSDIGSWQGLWSILERDSEGNSLRGDVVAVDCRNTFLRSEHRLVAALGLEDLVVVATDDAVLVSPLDRSQEVGQLVSQLGSDGRGETREHNRIYRPWGSYETVDAGEGFQVKRLVVKPGASISLQRHHKRAEHWVVVRGQAEVTRDDDVFGLAENHSTYIPIGAIHRLRNPGSVPLEVVEVQTGGYLGEDDIERFEDIYGRAPPGAADEG